MRGVTLILATTLTIGYGFAAQAAMKADRVATIRRVAGSIVTPAPTEADLTRVWYGGTLPAITVETTAAPKCQLT